MNTIQQIQQLISAKPDGVWGPKSQEHLINATDCPNVIKAVQKRLGVKADGKWGPVSQAALHSLIDTNSDGWMSCKASSFADPADVRAFERCKKTGKSDVACFAVGDNGIGQFGRITAQEHTPMIAVHKTEMVRRWGSVNAAAHREVVVMVGETTIRATVEDRISAPGRIDLNPACAKLAGLKPPFVVPCKWRWA